MSLLTLPLSMFGFQWLVSECPKVCQRDLDADYYVLPIRTGRHIDISHAPRSSSPSTGGRASSRILSSRTDLCVDMRPDQRQKNGIQNFPDTFG
jgi:hypothetical protein